jgi:hypothetical protein
LPKTKNAFSETRLHHLVLLSLDMLLAIGEQMKQKHGHAFADTVENSNTGKNTKGAHVIKNGHSIASFLKKFYRQ